MGRHLSLVCLAVLLPVSAGPVWAEPSPECAGQKVTISWRDPGVGYTIVGTSGPDVILGGPVRETILGNGGKDVICGGGRDDSIEGGAGRDQVFGQQGDDNFKGAPEGNLASDLVVGGSDVDEADYSTSPVGVRINLSSGGVLADGVTQPGGINGVEYVFGSFLDDELIGNNARNSLRGLEGNDFIDGRGGNNNLTGGADKDTLSYKTAKAPVAVDLSQGTATVGNGIDAPTDQVHGFEFIVGSAFGDRLLGTDENNEIDAGDGDDVIFGYKGDDILEGGKEDDSIHPGPDDDYVDGGPNDPVTGPGEPGDLVSYNEDTIDADDKWGFLQVHLTPNMFGDPPHATGVGDDELAGIESARGLQGETNDLDGDGGPNVFIGGRHFDIIRGKGGNDHMYGLTGEDAIDGDAGDDFLDGGKPDSDNDSDKLDGGDDFDVCVNARPKFVANCEET